MSAITEFHDLSNIIKKQLLSDSWLIALDYEPMGHRHRLRAGFSQTIDPQLDGEGLMNLIRDQIFNTKVMENQINGFNEEIERLNSEIEMLTVYKNHYDLEFKLKNGIPGGAL